MRRAWAVAILVALVFSLCAPALAAAAPATGVSKVVPLGWAIHNGKLVEGYKFVHGVAAPVAGGGGSKPAKPSPLYTFLASGAKWKTVEPFVVNGANGHSVAASAILDAMSKGVATWEASAGKDILGGGTLTDSTLVADETAPDGVNEVYFGTLDSGTVAVTIVWGNFSGPPASRQLIEWDMVFNDAQPEAWGDATVSSGAWDVLDIATHELGHSAGLGDLYQTAASEQTMYGYASPGETKKRSLESGDIAGIRALYK